MRIAIESKRKSEGLHQFDRPGFEIEHMRYRDLKRPSAVERARLVGAAISQAACRVCVMQTNEFRGHDDSSDLGGWIAAQSLSRTGWYGFVGSDRHMARGRGADASR
jgi:hypothetical protein